MPGEPDWDAELLEVFGVPHAALPPLVDTAGELGELRHPDWPRALPLRARIVDQQAALAGAGCVEPGRVKATYGTGVFVLANVGEELPGGGAEGLFPTVAWRIDGTVEFALDGGVFTAGALLNWLSEDLGLAADAPALAALAAEVEDSGGVRLLPALAGLGAPWWRPDAHAVVAGLTAAARPGHIARAALEAIAWRVADILAVVSEHASLDVLRVDGGLTRDPLLCSSRRTPAACRCSAARSTRPRPAPRRSRRWAPASGARPPRSPSGCRWESASSPAATTIGGRASTPHGAASLRPPPPFSGHVRRDRVTAPR